MTSIYGDNDGHEDSDLVDEFGVCEMCGDKDELEGGMCEGCWEWDRWRIDVVDSDELEEDEEGWADLDDDE